MAKNKKAKLNTNLDDAKQKRDSELLGEDVEAVSIVDISDDIPADDDLTYNMGEIIFDGDESDEDHQILVQGSKQVSEEEDADAKDDEDDEEWDEDVNFADEDQFLDDEYFDPEENAYD